MMEILNINGNEIHYQIAFKNNINTYFYFKKPGYIQVNAPMNQSKKKIIKFIIDNEKAFIKKLEKVSASISDNINYYLFDNKFKKQKDATISNLEIDYEKRLIKEPDLPIDQLNFIYKTQEKKMLHSKLEELKERYINNGLVDIENITFKTRYMSSRFGSCNPSKSSVNINLYLVNYEEKYLEYVFLHEISHLVHPNHSKNFYSLLLKLSRNYKQLRKELNNKFSYR